MNSLKCEQCGLVNFTTAEACKRCGNTLTENKSETSNSQPIQQDEQGASQQAQIQNLMPCPDCAHLCSRMAESCPSCGRVLQQVDKPVKSILRPVIVVSLFAVVCACAVLIYFTMQRQVVVQAAVQSGKPADAGVSSSNRAAARNALNAIGELRSVTSVGTNYMQYGAALQSAKIKFDAAMRDYKPSDAGDIEIQKQLEDTFDDYLAAREIWGAFIDNGEQYCMDANKSGVSSIAARYQLAHESGQICKETSIQFIWDKANTRFDAVSSRL